MTSFVEQIAPLIQKHAPKYNIKVVSPIIAQAILESASGTSELAVKAHNYFGLKYRKGRCPTATGIYKKVGSEQMDTGLYVSSVMQWCKFQNMEDGVIGYFDFINVANYANLKGITSPEQYLINIKQDGYATSKNYVQNLMNVIGKYGLTKYDKKGDEVMAYTNSGLVTTKLLAPYSNTWGARTHAIDTITIHCTAGQGTAYSIASIFQPVSRRASCNYSVGYDGSIGLVVEEKNASGCTSNKENDERAITIEVSTTNYHPYQCTDKAYDATIRLVADICKRNGIKQLKWSTNKSDRVNHRNGCNMTVHRDYENKPCVPISSEVLTKDGWVRIDEIEIGDEIACADLDNLNISFEEVYDKVPIKEQDTYTSNGLTATSDHRMVYRLQKQDFYRIDNFKNLFKKDGVYIPLAGYYNGNGLKMTDELMTFLIATQADGHYMYDVMKNGTKSYYGLEFHLKKERKISRIKEILLSLNLEFKESVQSDGSTKIRIYNQDGINIVDDICEKHLKNKCFTWNWIDMSKKQAEKFLDEILLWDGCLQANLYSSSCKENLDVVSAISSLNGVGSKVYGNNISFREKPFITLGEQKRNSKQHGTEKTKVCCVSVKTGIFLMRQKGKTFIVGNCPGDYLYNRMGDIASKVNAMLAKQSTTGTMQQSALTKVVYDYTLYETFVSRYYGKGVDFDKSFGNQCWDYVAQYAKVLGHTLPNCTQTGYVKDIANLKATNGILKWCDDIALNGQEMKKGDIIIWDGGQFPLSHIAIYTGRDSGNNGIYLGQNQPYPYGNERVFTSANMIGCFRPKVFKKTIVAEGNINYRVHCQTYGWLGYVYDGKMAGTTGKSKRMEALQIYTTDGTVIEQVDAHMQTDGWKTYKAPSKSTIIGTTGQAKRLEALRIKTSKPCKMRGHVQNKGWTSWVDCDGKAMIGTTGKSLRLEAIEIKRV